MITFWYQYPPENLEMSAQKNDNSAEPEEAIKPSEYVRELLKEKLSLNPEQHGNAMRLLDQGLYPSVNLMRTSHVPTS